MRRVPDGARTSEPAHGRLFLGRWMRRRKAQSDGAAQSGSRQRSRHVGPSFLRATLVVSVATAAIVAVSADHASAASVVITPTSATGFVHAADDGSALVDVTVCASFDQPVRFIEALVQFSGPILGVAILGPSGGAVTNWCGTVADLNAGPPGTRVIDVSWSAHNGNGLSLGHAHSTGSFTVPGAPPTPKKTPQQAASLGHASNAMWKAAAIIAVGGIVVGLSGGTLAPVVLGLLGSGLAAYIAADLSDLSIDPPDPNYMVPVVPHNLPLPRYVAGGGISAAAAAALNALHAVQEDETGQADAMVAALYKAEGAAAVNDVAWERTQTLAAADFARQLAIDLQAEGPLRRTARSELEAGGFPLFTVTEAQAVAQQDAWDSPGLTPSQKDALTLGGARPGMDDRLHALVRSSSPTIFVQQNILDLLAPAPAAAVNGIEAANAEAAAALLTWSDALKLNPVGPSPPSPAIIAGIQPNEGPAAGGTTVMIFGSNLLDTTQVNFGTNPALSGSCSESQCTVVSPPGSGTVDVTAIGPGGTSAVTEAGRFSYVTGVPGPIHLPAGTLITSGGFDPPGSESVQSFESLVGAAGAAKLGGDWEILAGSVDLVGPSSAQAAEGVQFVDLNGNDVAGPGTISQVIATLPGHRYRLSFQLAGNPNGDPIVKSLTASIGTTTQNFTFDTTGHTNTNLGWVDKNVDALICSSTVRVTLTTTTTGQRGPNIDAVSMVDLGVAPAGTCSAPVNHAPVAPDQAVSTNQDEPAPVTLTATDEDDDTLTYSIGSGPAHGTLSGTAPALTYTPAPGYTGADAFTFKANDGQLDSNTATVTITVRHVNHAPRADDLAVATDANTPVGIVLAGSDPDGDTLTFATTSVPAHGSLSGTIPSLIYTPSLDYSGSDSFTYVASDGTLRSNTATVTVTVHAPVNRPRADKRQALATLRSLLPTGRRHVDKKLENAIEHLEKSLDPKLWLDDSHLTKTGRKVFQEEKRAVGRLREINEPPGPVAVVVDALVDADQTLARTAIDEATTEGGDAKKISKAENEMKKASDMIANGYLRKAIEHYGRAWKNAKQSVS